MVLRADHVFGARIGYLTGRTNRGRSLRATDGWNLPRWFTQSAG